MDERYLIGGVCLRLVCSQALPLSPNMALFAAPNARPDYTYTLIPVDTLPSPEGRTLLARSGMQVCAVDSGEMRIVGIPGEAQPYGVYKETGPCTATVWMVRSRLELLQMEVVVLSLLCLERRLAQSSALLLHCAYTRRGGKALLFSAASGTGKTTQAGLWKQYENVDTVNGDKALLMRRPEGWYACGWPICGSSGVCHNEEMPVGAIVLLGQAPRDTVRRLQMGEAFPALYKQITCNRWNRAAVQHSLDLLEQLSAEVPVYHLDCTISKNAVDTLRGALDRDRCFG